MRNLILFLTRHYYILLFLLLESLSFLLIFQNNHFQRSHFLNSSNALAGSVYESYDAVTDYFSLREVNDKLSSENALLKNMLRQNVNLRTTAFIPVSDSLYQQQFEFLVARVVNNSTNRRKNYLTLNVGSKQGVTKESAVISTDGVVGIVRDVSDNFASVMSVLNEDSRIPVVIRRFGEASVMTWDGTDERTGLLERVPSHLDIRKGDTITTSSYSSIFPEGIMVGFVEDFEKVVGNTFYNVTVRLSTDFNKLHYVNVVNNLKKEEQETLEQKTNP